MELCKKCNGKHDLKKGCVKSEKKSLKKFRDAPPAPPLATGLGASISAGLSGGIKKSEVEGKSFAELKKQEGYQAKEQEARSFRDLKKREEDMMALEEKVGSLAAHIKDVLKNIK